MTNVTDMEPNGERTTYCVSMGDDLIYLMEPFQCRIY